MLDSAMPYYQSGLRNRLCYEITFNDYGKVINASGQEPTSDAKYEIKDILEYLRIRNSYSARFSKKYFRRIRKNGLIVRQSYQAQLISQIRNGIGHLITIVNP